MTSRVITRYRCDWCGTRAEVGHGAGVAVSLPPYWRHVAIERREADLCKLCSESLLAVVRAGPDLEPVPELRTPARTQSTPARMAALATRLGAMPAMPSVGRWTRGLAPRRTPSPRLKEARRAMRRRAVLPAMCAVLVLVAVVGVTRTGSVPVIFATSQPSHTSTPASVAAQAELTATEPEGTPAVIPPPPSAGAAAMSPAADAAAAGGDAAAAGGLAQARVTAVGDSVMLAAAEDLRRVLGTVDVDAAVGRQAAEALEVLRTRRMAGTLGSVVVLHIGDNGPLEVGQVDEMMQLLAEVPAVLVVTLHVPRPWEAANNTILADIASRYPNAALVDWAKASAERPELFWDDQTHLTPPGATVYADLVGQQLQSSSSTRQNALSASGPADSPTATVTPAPNAGGATLALTAGQATRVRVYVDGVLAFSDGLAAGESRTWAGSNEVRVWTDSGASLLVTVNGFALGPLAVAVGHPDWNTVDWSWAAGWTPQ